MALGGGAIKAHLPIQSGELRPSEVSLGVNYGSLDLRHGGIQKAELIAESEERRRLRFYPTPSSSSPLRAEI